MTWETVAYLRSWAVYRDGPIAVIPDIDGQCVKCFGALRLGDARIMAVRGIPTMLCLGCYAELGPLEEIRR